MIIPFGPYRPDIAETNPGVSRSVVNVDIRKDATGVSYHPRAGLAIIGSEALPAQPRGGISVVNRNGEFKGFFCTASNIYSLDADYGFTSISSGYSLPTGDHWGLCQYGDNLIATNTDDGMFEYDIESGGTVDAISGAPKARSVFAAFECVFALDCDGDNRIMKNSAPGSRTNWTTQGAGYQDFADGEALIAGGAINDGTAAVLQRKAIHLLRVTGDKRIYSRVTLAQGVGAVNPQCVVQAPGALYFFDTGGFAVVAADGWRYIGADRVNRSFLKTLGDEGLAALEGAYDPTRRQVVWRYQKQGASSSDVLENLIVYDIATGEFVEVEQTSTAVVKMSSPAQTLEELDTFSSSLDALPYSLDNDVWKGNRPRMAALDADYKFGFFDGANLAASVETATLLNARSMLVSSATPVTDASAVTLALGVKNRLADATTWKPDASMKASGRVPLRGRGKAIVLRAEIPAGEQWSYLRGIDGLDMTMGGPK